jgi:DNA-binding GntR family transcriptional regulator
MQSDTSEKRSLSQRIRADIEQAIMAGRLQAGAPLDEQTLGERYGVSRTPAREALIQLAAVGLVSMRPRRGAVVAAASLKDCMNLLEMLVQLEALATGLATRRMNAEERARLQDACSQCLAAAQEQHAERYRIADDAFHDLLYTSSRNPILSAQIRTTRARMCGMGDARFENPARVRASLQEHQNILAAVLRGDDKSASEAMVAHILSGGQVHADLMARLG